MSQSNAFSEPGVGYDENDHELSICGESENPATFFVQEIICACVPFGQYITKVSPPLFRMLRPLDELTAIIL